jgi:hypothetical protein
MKLIHLFAVAALAATSVFAYPAGALAQAQPEVTYQTRNGPRTVDQLQRELTASGYGGPRDTASMLVAYDRAGLPSIDPYTSATTWSCFTSNPSCARDPWWAEWNEHQDDTHVSY